MRFVLLAVLLITPGCGLEFDYYDISTEYGKFQIECGTPESPVMWIRYLGDANSVYADFEPENCTLTEVATAFFELDDALNNPYCPVVRYDDLNVTSLDVVVQMGAVRKVTDEVHVIMCSYEAGGQRVSDMKGTSAGWLQLTPEFTIVDDQTSLGNISLHVYGIDGYPLTDVILGSYIQLRAFFMPSTEEASLRLWNCRAMAGTENTYYMFANGCGDGRVVPSRRGFRTALEEDLVPQGIGRVARSAYFRAFTFPGRSDVQFECDFSTCSDSQDCDGVTCNSNHRSRRQVAGKAVSLHEVFSEPVRIRRNANHNGSTDRNANVVPSAYDYPPGVMTPQDRKPAMMTLAPEKDGEEWSLLTTTLVTACAVMAALLVAAVVYSACLWRKIHRDVLESVPRHQPYRFPRFLPQLVKKPLSSHQPPAFHTWDESSMCIY